MRGDKKGEKIWRAHLTKIKLESFEYLYKEIKPLATIFNKFYPIVGLWQDVRPGSLHDHLYMKCPEIGKPDKLLQ